MLVFYFVLFRKWRDRAIEVYIIKKRKRIGEWALEGLWLKAGPLKWPTQTAWLSGFTIWKTWRLIFPFYILSFLFFSFLFRPFPHFYHFFLFQSTHIFIILNHIKLSVHLFTSTPTNKTSFPYNFTLRSNGYRKSYWKSIIVFIEMSIAPQT